MTPLSDPSIAQTIRLLDADDRLLIVEAFRIAERALGIRPAEHPNLAGRSATGLLAFLIAREAAVAHKWGNEIQDLDFIAGIIGGGRENLLGFVRFPDADDLGPGTRDIKAMQIIYGGMPGADLWKLATDIRDRISAPRLAA